MRVTDDETRTAQRRVEDYLRGQDARGFDVGNPQHFEQLVNRVKTVLPHVAEDDLRVVTATCWLGPEFAGIPPPAMRDELLSILRRLVPDQPERLGRVMEFAIAYGCGRWRAAVGSAWDDLWDNAVYGLARAAEPAVSEADRWLQTHVVGYPSRSRDDLQGEARTLAMRLVRPEKPLHIDREQSFHIVCTDDDTRIEGVYEDLIPPGAKAVFAVAQGVAELMPPQGQPLALLAGTKVIVSARDEEARIEAQLGEATQRARLRVNETAQVQPADDLTLVIWRCTCGNQHCGERHRLETWDPIQVSLWAFVASAVKGPQPNIQTGSFAQGVEFALLAKEGL
jgi:hypothetical protein